MDVDYTIAALLDLSGTVVTYTFINAAKVLADFFDFADAYMKETH